MPIYPAQRRLRLSCPGIRPGHWLGRLACFLLLLLLAGNSYAKGLIPERNNQITICTDSPAGKPSFSLLFSSKPLAQTLRQPDGRISTTALQQTGTDRQSLLLVVGGKEAGQGHPCYDFFFGPGPDGNQPWNNGTAFHWRDWQRYSDELWDNVVVAAGETGQGVARLRPATVTQVALRRGGRLLFDSRMTHSVPNNNEITVRIPPVRLDADQESAAVVDLGAAMPRFKQLYYELGESRVLQNAYGDLGQTDGSKYTPTAGSSWCSEFAAYTYRQSGINAPDPVGGRLNWRVLKTHFRQQGTVYELHDVARWSQQEREARIKPGSLVSMVTSGGSAHLMLLTAWLHGDEAGRFTAISGNNHDMVWHHASLSVSQFVQDEERRGRSRGVSGVDERYFFAVPAGMTP